VELHPARERIDSSLRVILGRAPSSVNVTLSHHMSIVQQRVVRCTPGEDMPVARHRHGSMRFPSMVPCDRRTARWRYFLTCFFKRHRQEELPSRDLGPEPSGHGVSYCSPDSVAARRTRASSMRSPRAPCSSSVKGASSASGSMTASTCTNAVYLSSACRSLRTLGAIQWTSSSSAAPDRCAP